MDADRAFKELTMRSGALFRAHGFKGSGQNFKRRVNTGGEPRDEQWQGVNFQKSQWRIDSSHPIHFYVNIGVHFPGLERTVGPCWAPRPVSFEKYTPMKSDLRLRLGDLLPDHDDGWLTVDGGALELFWDRFATVLEDVVVPSLDRMRTREGLARQLRRIPLHADAARDWLREHAIPVHNSNVRDAGLWRQDREGLWWGPGETAPE